MIKLKNIINELNVNKPLVFWDMVKEIIYFDTYFAEGLLNNWYNDFGNYVNDFGLDDADDLEKYKYYFDYFSKIQPSEIKSKIDFKIFNNNMNEINEGISYKFIEMWYIGDGDFGLALHNNNKIFLNE